MLTSQIKIAYPALLDGELGNMDDYLYRVVIPSVQAHQVDDFGYGACVRMFIRASACAEFGLEKSIYVIPEALRCGGGGPNNADAFHNMSTRYYDLRGSNAQPFISWFGWVDAEETSEGEPVWSMKLVWDNPARTYMTGCNVCHKGTGWWDVRRYTNPVAMRTVRSLYEAGGLALFDPSLSEREVLGNE